MDAAAWTAQTLVPVFSAQRAAMLMCVLLVVGVGVPGALNRAHAQSAPVAQLAAPGAGHPQLELAPVTEAPCSARVRLPSPPVGDSVALDAAIDVWLPLLGQCQRDPVYLMTLGQMLIRQGRYLEASDHLERALLFNPTLKEARVDYAIALAGAGDIPSALAMVADLLADPDLPPHLRASLMHQRTALAEAGAPAWQTRVVATTRIGHDSNLSGAPNLGSLTLTIAGQPVLLPLDEAYQARGGAYARADLQLEARHHNSDGSQWNLLASLRTRRSPAVPNTGTQTADLVLERSHYSSLLDTPHAAGYYASASGGLLQAQAGTRYQALGAGLGWGVLWRDGWIQDCQTRMGAEAQQRQHQTNAVLSGLYLGLAAVISCERSSGVQWLVSLRSGRDAARSSERPGGGQQQNSLRFAGYLPLAPWASAEARTLPWDVLRHGGLLLDVEASHYRDATGYSPLLQNGALRILRRNTARLEYQLSVAKTLQWTLGAEWVQQRSSLDLFRLQSHGPYTALRVSW
ncbi:tetratricopeptide (TPR) repeat protein [Acidovorax delafieldii]|nr:tetratricopeptide (TPR) repeat protein [Acidovorax delafieldii]